MALPDTIEQRILARLMQLLTGITQSAGYRTDLGNSVAYWRGTPWDPAELPAMELRDTGTTIEEQTMGAFEFTTEVEVRAAFVATEHGSLKTLCDAKADVMAAIGRDDLFRSIGLNCPRIIPTRSDKNVAQDEERIIGFRIVFEIRYRTQRWDPTKEQ